MLSVLTGRFRNILVFSVLILVHEFGHSICAFALGWKVVRISLYPYGGCSVFNQDVNVPIWQEFLVLIMGPIAQILFVFLLSHFLLPSTLALYVQYSHWILLFNFMPIYPLDGGQLLFLGCNLLFSYYHSFQFVFYFSYFILLSSIFLLFFSFPNLMLLFIFVLLFQKLFLQMRHMPFYYQRFLLERYLNSYSFQRTKQIRNDHQMQRDKNHVFYTSQGILLEKDYLKMQFYN